MANFSTIVADTFELEGGYQADSADSANWCNNRLIGTNRGIAAITYKTYYGGCPTVPQMKALTRQQAENIYRTRYWNNIQGDSLKSQSVAHIVFDSHVHSGFLGIKHVRQAINKVAGRQVVAETSTRLTKSEAEAINSLDQKTFFDTLKAIRLKFYEYLAQIKPEKRKFLAGWKNRMGKINYIG